MRDVEIKRVFHPLDQNEIDEPVLPSFIPEEAEKLSAATPLWKMKLVRESLKYIISDEDAGVQELKEL